MATVDAMQVANKAMKKQYKGIDIDKIEVSQSTLAWSWPGESEWNAKLMHRRVYIMIWRI